MATARRPASSTSNYSSPALIVQQLTDLFRINGHRILHGDKVCLTSESLTLLNNYFQLVDLDITPPTMNDHIRSDSLPLLPQLPPIRHMRIDTKLRENLVFLHDFLRNKIKSVKLIQNTSTLQGNVLLHPFHNITCLELKKIQPNMIRGLAVLREQLETLICSHSVLKIETLINDCGADSTHARDWPRLKSLFLDHNFIESIDQSLRYLPVLEILDLSHNRLHDCSKIFEIIPHLKHLNLSSNHIRHIPTLKHNRGSSILLTLKIRQNLLEDVKGIETLKSIEELDLSDNYITLIPEQIRQLTGLKRIFFQRNPFTYDSDYRNKIIRNLPFVFANNTRDLIIDNQQLTLKERQKIPLRRPATSNSAQGFTIYSTPTSIHSTTSDSTTEPDSITTTTTTISAINSSRLRSRRRHRSRHSKNYDRDETPTGHRTSSSDADKSSNRRRLNKVIESKEEINENLPIISGNTSSSGIVEPDDNNSKTTPSVSDSISHKLSEDLSDTNKQRKNTRCHKSDAPNRIFLQVVDVTNNVSDDTAVPDSPISVTELSISQNHPTPMPVLEPKTIHHDEPSMTCSDNLRSIFFVTDQTMENHRLLIVEFHPLDLIEKDHDNEEYIEKIRYSTMKLNLNEHDDKKTVKFTFEKRRYEIEQRIYVFDTLHDRKAFVEEIERHLEKPNLAEIPIDFTTFLQCSKCNRSFPPINSMNNNDSTFIPICLTCQNSSIDPTTILNHRLQSNTSVDISVDEIDLDHRLHFQVANEHFTHNNEKIRLHFKCYVVHSATNKFFIARTILTNYGIYIFQYEILNNNENMEYILVGKDLLTNVLMLDIGYRLQTFTIELQSAAFAFILADEKKTQQIAGYFLEVLSPIITSDEGALQKISHISSDEYRQRLFEIIKIECEIDEPNDEMIDFYSIMIRMDQTGNSQMIALLLLQNWILMIEDDYVIIDSRHVRLPARLTSESNQQLKCDLMHLVNVTNYVNHRNEFLLDFVDQSETKQYQWKLESLSNESKDNFLIKVRDSYKKHMAVTMPETFETI